jgi:hypothetical protein
MNTNYNTMTPNELVRSVINDPNATAREKELAARLAKMLDERWLLRSSGA